MQRLKTSDDSVIQHVILNGAKRSEESPGCHEILRSSRLRLDSLRMTMVAVGTLRDKRLLLSF